MGKDLIRSRTCVYNVNYHVVWVVKYRRKVLTEAIETEMRQWAMETAKEKGFTVHLFEAGDMDHIHCFVSAPPKISISYIVKMLKGILGRKALYFHPELREFLWKGELWSHSYYAETIGSVSEDAVRHYIENQSKAY